MSREKDPLITFISDRGIEGFRRFYGTYIGVVISIEDPENRNRLLVKVPEVYGHGKQVVWALPKQISGSNFGFNFIPKVGEVVWVSFRNGAPIERSALWEPGFYALKERPEEFTPTVVGHKYRDGALSIYDESTGEFKWVTINQDIISFKAGEFSIITKDGPKITIGSKGVQLAGHNNTESAVLGDTLKSTLSTLITTLSTLTDSIIAIDLAATAGSQATVLGGVKAQLTTISTGLDTILAT
jgi:hypothetical protein